MAEVLQAVVSDFWESRLVHAFAELGIADVMAKQDGPMSSGDIAVKVKLTKGGAPQLLYRVLRCLSVSESQVVKELSLDCFQLTDSGSMLQSGKMRSLVLLELGATHRAVWNQLETLLRNGQQNGFVRAFNMKIFDYANSDARGAGAYSAMFDEAMSAYTLPQLAAARKICTEVFPHGGVRKVVDVGGGPGALTEAVLESTGASSAVVTELRSVVRNAPAEHHPALSFKVMDFFQEAEPGGDLYVLKHVLHDWTDEQCTTILQNVRRAAVPGACIIVFEYVIAGPGVPSFGKAFDAHMLVATDGKERSFVEYQALLEGAGFERVHLHDGGAIQGIEARVPLVASPID